MPIVYSFDAEHGLIRTVVTGHVTRADVGEYFRQVQKESYFPAPSLTDVRDASADLSGDDVRGITKDFQCFGEAMRPCPIAVVVSSELSYGLTRMISLLLDDVANIRPFRDEDAATAWLEVECAAQKK